MVFEVVKCKKQVCLCDGIWVEVGFDVIERKEAKREKVRYTATDF